jgi:hypothetical protein
MDFADPETSATLAEIARLPIPKMRSGAHAFEISDIEER